MRIASWAAPLVAVLFMLSIVVPFAQPAKAQEPQIVIALDLAHGESDKYIDYIISNVTFAEFRIINTTINETTLEGVDVLILGQPTVSLSVEEMDAIVDWLNQGNKVLWVAGDSDYGSGNETQKIVNNFLEYIGAKLRLEYASVYDDYHNCQRFYRVLFRVIPDSAPDLYTDIIAENITKPILGHGPAPLIWVDENGTAHDIVNETFPGLIRIAWSYDTAYIGDNNPPPPLVYDVFTYGQGSGNHTFVFIAAEYWSDLNDLIVVSGESPYGDYEPTWSWEYYGVELDGPQFVTNMFKWFAKLITTQQYPPETTTTTTPPMTTTTPPETTTTTTPPPTTGAPTTTTTTTPSMTTTSPPGTTTTTTPPAGGETTTTTTTTTPPGTTSPAQPAQTTTETGGQTALIAVIIIILVIIVGAYFFLKS